MGLRNLFIHAARPAVIRPFICHRSVTHLQDSSSSAALPHQSYWLSYKHCLPPPRCARGDATASVAAAEGVGEGGQVVLGRWAKGAKGLKCCPPLPGDAYQRYTSQRVLACGRHG
jgi:hypothetical protein